MLRTTASLLALAVLQKSTAFIVQGPSLTPSCASNRAGSPTAVCLSSSNPDDAAGRRHSSRIEGNQREPSAQELEVMDEMITKLANAKPYELPNAVQRAFRVISSPRFFLRIAERTDQCQDDQEKEKLAALASNLVSTLDAVVSTAEEKLGDIAVDVETVVKAAAEPDSGEFLVPLSKERVDAMRTALNKVDASSLEGDAFLTTVDAWMNKSHLDGMDGMVGILQKVLQMYAGRRIREVLLARANKADKSSSSDAANSALFDQLLQTDADAWDAVIRQGVSGDAAAAEELTRVIHRNMESIVLQLDSGSMAQQVQAEYLKEMVKRVEAVEKTLL